MIVIMKMDRTEQQRDAVFARLKEGGLRGQEISGESRTVIAVLGQVYPELRDDLSVMAGVDDVVRISKPYKLSSREVKPNDTVVKLPYGIQVGGGRPVVMAGPCSIETEDQLWAAARGVHDAGAHVLRGGAPLSWVELDRLNPAVDDMPSMPPSREGALLDVVRTGAAQRQAAVLAGALAR